MGCSTKRYSSAAKYQHRHAQAELEHDRLLRVDGARRQAVEHQHGPVHQV
jgi:hypothetical protein